MTNNALKKKATDVLLDFLEKKCRDKFYVAGGAPRDWYFNREVGDVDIYYEGGKGKGAAIPLKSEIKAEFEKNGITVKSITKTNKTSTYGFNSNIRKVVGLQVNTSGCRLEFDLIKVNSLTNGFEDIFKSYDCDICMIGYSHGKLQLSQAFMDYDNGRSISYTNDLLNRQLLRYSKQVHFPKIQKKYPEIKTFTNTDFKVRDFQIGRTLDLVLGTPIKSTTKKTTTKPQVPVSNCTHDWAPFTMLYSVVYDCRLCGVKKEDYA